MTWRENANSFYTQRLPEPRHKSVKMSRAKRKDLWGTGDDVNGPGAYSGTGVQLHFSVHGCVHDFRCCCPLEKHGEDVVVRCYVLLVPERLRRKC